MTALRQHEKNSQKTRATTFIQWEKNYVINGDLEIKIRLKTLN